MTQTVQVKRLGVACCGLVLGAAVFSPAAEANLLSNIRQSISSLWGQKAAHQHNARAALSQASAVHAQADSVHDRLERAQQALLVATATFSNYNGQLRRTEARINQTRRDIAVTKRRYAAHRQHFADRLGEMQHYGQPSFVEVVFGSKSLSDLTRRTAMYRAITQQDADLQASLKADQDQLQQQQNMLASQCTERYRLATMADKERVRIYNAKYQQAVLWQKLNSSTYELLSYASEQQRSSNEITGMIGDLENRKSQIIAEYEAQAAAERRARMAQRIHERRQPQFAPHAVVEPAPRYAPRLAPRIRMTRAQLAPMPVEALPVHGTLSDNSTTVPEWSMPARGRLSSRFGYRYHPILHRVKLHTGDDIAAPMGSPFKASRSGRVLWAGWKKAYGNTIIVDNGNGITTLYGHASKIGVRAGQPVKAGEYLGNVGSTGWSTGPHLHFEVRQNGKPVNPLGYLHMH